MGTRGRRALLRCVAPLASGLLVAALLAGCDANIVPTASPSPIPTPAQATVPLGPTALVTLAEPTSPAPTESATLPPETAVRPSADGDTTPPSSGEVGGPPGFGSSAFRATGGSQRIPPKYTCDGIDVSPPLEWSVGNPDQVAEFAIVVTDPDAHDFTHWVVARIPGTDTGLDEGAGDPNAGNGLLQGQNGFGSIGWRGPCPPAGSTHHYHFALYAFASAPDLTDAPTADKVRQAGGTPEVAFEALYGH